MRCWEMCAGDYLVSVQQLPSGTWLASTGLKMVLDKWGITLKQETFNNVVDALRWVGYPAEQTISGMYFDVPDNLRD